MKQNMGTIDKVIRIILAATIAGLYFAGLLSGTAAIVLGLFAVILILTSLTSFCPLYLPLNLSTRGNKDSKKKSCCS